MATHLPNEVEEFILKYIDSLEELEILLLVRGTPEAVWTPESVNREIKSSVDSVAQRLSGLAAKGLLQSVTETPPTYRYQTASAPLAEVVQTLAGAYKERRLRVIECLFSKPFSSLRIFSDAFKIRKEPDHG